MVNIIIIIIIIIILLLLLNCSLFATDTGWNSDPYYTNYTKEWSYNI